MTTRTQDEIDEQMNAAREAEDDGGSNWPGMTYEQGVVAALMWVTGATEDAPMDSE